MKHAIAMAAIAAVGLSGGAAFAQNADDECFDKGDLTYFDCPVEEEPVVVEEEEMMFVEDESGYYAGFRGGVAFLDDTSFEFAGLEIVQDYNTGIVVSAMLGYNYADAIAPGVSLRPELEIGYLWADVDVHDIEFQEVPNDGSDGDTSVLFGFLNLFADIEITADIDLIVGGGVGIGNVDFDDHGVDATGVIMDDDDWGFGYNVGAGVGVALDEDVTLEGMYRFMSFDADLEAVDGTESDVDVDAHTVTLGLRFDF